VRAATLETLASTSKPLSAYRLAKVAEAQPIQVLTVLKALEPELVQYRDNGWVLVNDSLRSFLREELARLEADRRSEKDELLTQSGLKPRALHGRH